MRYWLDTFSTGYIDPDTGLRGITSDQSSMIVSLLSAGTFFGALTAAPTYVNCLPLSPATAQALY